MVSLLAWRNSRYEPGEVGLAARMGVPQSLVSRIEVGEFVARLERRLDTAG